MSWKGEKHYIKRAAVFVMIISLLMPNLMLFSFALTDEEIYKASLAEKGFPESYQELLWQMHQRHPNWQFKALSTGADFDVAVQEECATGKNTIAINKDYDIIQMLLLSKSYGNGSTTGYYQSDGTYIYKVIDGNQATQSGHVDATPLAVSYFMDPRNFLLDDMSILQFEELLYDPSVHTLTAVQHILSGTFMNGNTISYTTTSGTTATINKSYAQVVIEAAQATNVNPCYLASKIIQEVGSSGSGSVSGTESGYVGYYNFFNIGAYASNTGDAITNGLKRAVKEGWDNPEKAIKGGATFIDSSYINKGQHTPYLQKFNVNPNAYYAMYTHQYMSAVHDPAQSARSTYKSYNSTGTIEDARTFVIPVYNNMPDFNTTSVKLNNSSSMATTVSGSYIRNTPSYKYTSKGEPTNVVTTLPKNSTVEILDRVRSSTIASQYGALYLYQLYYPFWYKVKYNNGSVGYTSFENLQINSSYTMNLGSTYQLGYTLTPINNNSVRFTSLDSRIATVDAKTGLVTALKAGTTRIIAYTASGSVDYVDITVNVPIDLPSRLTSSVYAVSEDQLIVSQIPAGTTVEMLLNAINEKQYAAVYSGNERLSSSTRLATGMQLSLVNGSTRIKSYVVAVRGDTNCDGYVKTGDASQVLQHISGLTTLDGARAVAADANGDGYIKTGDAVTILKS